ncbi:DUF2142 domain-containing protein [Actinotalea sp.]|uniref:DUF2142 domain-containing protein n=1 Tax=Actinotalea sp. TaxID=1872145 RepID=UPI0035643D72
MAIEAPARPGSNRRVFWRAFALISLVTALWSLASPLAAGPDENAHIVKAAAVVRGDLHGTSAPDNPGSGIVTVPAEYASMMAYPTCFAFKPEVSADCAGPLLTGEAAEEPTQAPTWVIRNNPAYYAIVGLPTLLPAAPWTIYLMRLISGLLSSAVLAWAFATLARLPRRAPLALGLLTAMTPMVIFLNSVVNSSGLEISASLALWAGLFALLRYPDPAQLTRRAAGIAVVTVALANTRGLSLLYVAVIVLAAVASAPLSSFVATAMDRRTWPWLGLIVAGVGSALWWTFSEQTLAAGGSTHPDLTFLSVAKRTFLESGDYLVTSIGNFGWLDTALPATVKLAFAAVLGLVVLLALAIASRRDVALLLGVAAMSVVIPVLLHAWQAHAVGYIWTARYSMPLFVGVPVVAGFIAHRQAEALAAWADRRLVLVAASTLAVVQLLAFAVNLRRYVFGAPGSWNLLAEGDWSPPVAPGILLLLLAGTLAAAVVAAVRWSSPERA